MKNILRLTLLFIFIAPLIYSPGGSGVSTAFALNPPALQTYYLPLPEDDMLQVLDVNFNTPTSPVRSISSIAIGTNGTYIYYDQWEDGSFETDIANPGANIYDAAANPDGTQIWGDGVLANGCAPRLNNIPNPCAMPSDDELNKGDVITLDNNVIVNGSLGSYSRNPSQIYFDGRDKVGASLPVAVTRAIWPSEIGSLVADAVEVLDTSNWGTQYVSPIGENNGSRWFEDTRWLIMAQAGGAAISVDANGDGDYVDGNDLNNFIMNEGDRKMVDGIFTGATLDVASGGKAVQVAQLLSDTDSGYANRFFTLVPRDKWEKEYYSPVGTGSGATCTEVWVYNPNATQITVNYTFSTGSGNFSVNSKTAARSPVVPLNSGARFYTNDPVFLPFSVTDCTQGNNGDIYDWGNTLFPVSRLTPEVLVSWAPGCTNESAVGVCLEADGSPTNTKSRSVVWVTPLADTTLYVDMNGSGIDCSTGAGAERTIAASALQGVRIADDPDNVRHEFSDPDYAANGGGLYSQNWTTAWTETDGTGGATGGAIWITGGVLQFRYVSRTNETDRAIQRSQNLSGKGFTRLSFRLQGAGLEGGDGLDVQVSSTGAAPWTTLASYNGNMGWSTQVFDISGFTSANTTIRFRIAGNLDSTDVWSVDNVNIDFTPDNGDGDFDMTGAYIRTCNEALIAAVFGQSPALSGSSDNEAMDLGMAIAPYGARISLKKVADKEYVRPGELVTYTYRVDSILGTAVNNVSVEDNFCSPVTAIPGGNPNFNIGDLNTNNLMEDTEVWQFRCSTRLYVETRNTAIAYAFIGAGRISSAPDQAIVKMKSTLGDYVWVDEDGDGDQDAGEPGIPNAKVTLTGTDIKGNAVNVTTYTDANGRYLFNDLLPSNSSGYTITIDPLSLPSGLAANPTYDENGIGTPHATNVILTSAVEYTTADFGYNWASPAETNVGASGATGAIGDRIWIDANGNGKQDPGEPGLYNVSVELVTPGPDGVFGTSDDVVAATTTSNYAGNYIFDGLGSGAYLVRIPSPPAGYAQTGDPDQPGVACTICDGKTTAPILLAPGDVYLNTDFGFQPTAGNGATIGDTIWLDANRNNTQDSGEPGLAGVTVALIRDLDGDGVWDVGEPIIATDITDSSGQYAFAGLPVTDGTGSDDYIVWVNDTSNVLYELTAVYDADGASPASGLKTGLGVSAVSNLTPAGNDLQDFAYAPAGHDTGEALVGDTLWLDQNGNSAFDFGEGIEGVLVNLLDGNGNVIARTRTNENGQYFFGNLPAGNYTIDINTNTLPNFGVDLVNFSDPDGGVPNRASTNLSAGEVDLTQDFGYRDGVSPNSLSGTLWMDSNADGVQDGSETTVFHGVTVALYMDSNDNGVLDTGDMQIGVQTTDASGNYSFTGLPDDTYFVDVIDDNNVLDGYWHSLGLQAKTADGQSKADYYTINLSGGENRSTVDFGYYLKPSTVGNFVWLDLDGDGVQDPNEPGIQGIKVTLNVTYPGGGSATFSTLTGPGGVYSFGNLLLDEDYNIGDINPTHPIYTISVGTPTSMSPSPENANAPGNNDQIDGDSDGASEIATIFQGETDTSYDFGFLGQVDLGDLPQDIPASPDYPTFFQPGPANIVFPDTSIPPDNKPDTTGGVAAVWLGATVDTESDGQPSIYADGDGADEDGLAFAPSGWEPGQSSSVTVTLNSSESGQIVYFGLWIDWNDDGDFTDPEDGFYYGSGTTGSPVDVPVTVAVPISHVTNTPNGWRVRAAMSPLSASDYQGTILNGETEDYRRDFNPTAISLLGFTVTTDFNQVILNWQTASEIDANGFNIYRSTSPDGPGIHPINPQMIDLLNPGGVGMTDYFYYDTDFQLDVTYYYWLEFVDSEGSHWTEAVQIMVGSNRLYMPVVQK